MTVNIQDELIGSISQALISATWSWLSRKVVSAGNEQWNQLQIADALKAYVRSYQMRYGNVNVLGMPKPLPLDQLYTNVNVVSNIYLSNLADEQELEKQFTSSRTHSSFSAAESKSGLLIANQQQFLNLLGSAGSGKSTFLRRLGQVALLRYVKKEDIANEEYQHQRIPVLLELRKIQPYRTVELESLIAEEFKACGFPHSAEFVSKGLEEGKFLLLLDGLDEVKSECLSATITAIQDIVSRHGNQEDGNRFVTSCRTSHYRSYLSQFTNVVLTDFSDQQISHFVNNWFSSDDDKREGVGHQLNRMLKSDSYKPAQELSRTPLLLTFMCLTYQHRQQLPATIATLYKSALDILISEWAAERRVHNDPIPGNLHYDIEIEMLSELAAKLFAEEKFFFKKSVAVKFIETFFAKQTISREKVNPADVFDAIERQQGIFVRRSYDAYSFSHLTIQEYLTAKKIWEDGREQVKNMVEIHFQDSRYNNVFQIMAGLSKADFLISTVADYLQNLLSTTVADNRILMKAISSMKISGGSIVENSAKMLLMLNVLYMRISEAIPETRDKRQFDRFRFTIALIDLSAISRGPMSYSGMKIETWDNSQMLNIRFDDTSLPPIYRKVADSSLYESSFEKWLEGVKLPFNYAYLAEARDKLENYLEQMLLFVNCVTRSYSLSRAVLTDSCERLWTPLSSE